MLLAQLEAGMGDCVCYAYNGVKDKWYPWPLKKWIDQLLSTDGHTR
jgi:hypothetical protein